MQHCLLSFVEYFGAIANGEYENNGREKRLRTYEKMMIDKARKLINEKS